MTDPAVSARSLVKDYGEIRAVDGLDFDIASGESVGFLGPNGAGKSSTMRMIGCTSPPSAGSLTVFGRPAAASARTIRARLGVVPQDDTLDLELTVTENLYVYGCYFGLPRKVIRARSAQLLESFHLADRATARVTALSGGMRRRLTIARALINEPEMLLLDEPTNGLDPQARHKLWEQLRQLQRRGRTLVLTTHFMDEAEHLCDRLFIVDRGRIVTQGTPHELISRYCGREMLELRFSAEEPATYADQLATVGSRVEVTAGQLLVHVDNGDVALAAVTGLGIPFDTALVRRASLEDVFLRLTGRTLVD